MAGYSHDAAWSVPEDPALLAEIIPLQVRWPGTYIEFVDEEYSVVELVFTRKMSSNAGEDFGLDAGDGGEDEVLKKQAKLVSFVEMYDGEGARHP